MQIRSKIIFTLLGVLGGWARMIGVLHDTFLAVETYCPLTYIYVHTVTILRIHRTRRANASCTNLEQWEGWRVILLYIVQ